MNDLWGIITPSLIDCIAPIYDRWLDLIVPIVYKKPIQFNYPEPFSFYINHYNINIDFNTQQKQLYNYLFNDVLKLSDDLDCTEIIKKRMEENHNGHY